MRLLNQWNAVLEGSSKFRHEHRCRKKKFHGKVTFRLNSRKIWVTNAWNSSAEETKPRVGCLGFPREFLLKVFVSLFRIISTENRALSMCELKPMKCFCWRWRQTWCWLKTFVALCKCLLEISSFSLPACYLRSPLMVGSRGMARWSSVTKAPEPLGYLRNFGY